MAKKRKGKKGKTRTKSSWSEFRARLSSGTKLKLMLIVKVLWSSASITAKNKAIKIASAKSFAGKIKSKVKARKSKGKRRSKIKKKAWMVKGSKAAKAHMKKVRNARR